MIPVYNEFKDKGFEVVGLAREFKNTRNFERQIKKDKYPWIDLDDQYQIWLKYNVPFGGGGTFLVDENGKILAINTTSEEVRNTLSDIL
ncbi:MAG: alkyl hydroperoxide reductase subunit AhpC [Cyclobacteriaceae bacterium]|jgi:alkyl hydroperoxide reductase subunit AhpC